MCVKRRVVFDIAVSRGFGSLTSGDVIRYLEDAYNQDVSALEEDVRRLVDKLQRKWNAAHRRKDRFMIRNGAWLEVSLCLPRPVCRPGGGRHRLAFSKLSRVSKLRATSKLRQESSSEQLVFAATSATYQEGRRSACRLLGAVSCPVRGPPLAAALSTAGPSVVQPYSPEEALALLVDLGLTKAQYVSMQQEAKRRAAPIYPIYNRVSEAKSASMPPLESITVTADGAEVTLQALLNHTAGRLLQLPAVRAAAAAACHSAADSPAAPTELLCLTLTIKWGMDGSTGHSQYKMADSEDDSQLLLTSLVPLQLDSEDGRVLWRSSAPSSPRMCRPLAIRFTKETTALILAERQRVEDQASHLQPLRTELGTIKYVMVMTMVDTKVVNAITSTASQNCTMCGATPSQMNDLAAVTCRPVTNTEYGLSTLHSWIRVFEAVLHISYRLPLQPPRWQVRGGDREQMKEAKAEVQRRLRDSLGLRADEPRCGGSGNSNDGNTARRAFRSPEKFAAATGVDEELVRRLHLVLEAVTCCRPLSVPALSAFCWETARLYVRLYAWYPMPPTLHRLLIHSAEVVERCLLPIGMMSEEAAEARHKDLRVFRLRHTRKDSRLHTMSDLLGRLLVTSDPLISSLRQEERRAKQTRRHGPLPPEVYALLAAPELPEQDTCSSDSDSDDSGSDDV